MKKPDVCLKVGARFILALVPALFCATAIAQSLSDAAVQQIQSLLAEKDSRSPAQQKLDSQLHYAYKLGLNQPITPAVPFLNLPPGSQPNPQGMFSVDISANVTPALIAEIQAEGGQVINAFPQYNAIRANLPLLALDSIAGRSEVKFIRAADEMQVNRTETLPKAVAARRASNIRAQLTKALPALAAKRRLGSRIGLAFARPVEVAGDIAHQANLVRSMFGFDGTGIKVGVMSNGVGNLALLQGLGDLPAVTVLPGQAGTGSEGTAMLEIVYDLAPGAQLFFATANPSQAQFAANILGLRAAGCDIIVDDVTYFAEGAFQDGIIAQAVNTVTASGAMYFSSAANSGNLTDGTSGTWEGDFSPGVITITTGKGTLTGHDFGGTFGADLITAATGPVSVKWSDPLGLSCNDYDLFILDNALTTILAASTTVQNCTQDPFEIVAGLPAGNQIVVTKTPGAAVRALHLDTERGRIEHNTAGNTFGHNAAGAAITVAAVNVGTAGGGVFVGGATNPVEFYNSDGPRRIFYTPAGMPLTPGNFLFGTNGGVVLQKDDMAAADCGASAVPGFSPFCGTSAAAPHAAAIAALIKSGRPALTAANVLTAMNHSALDIMAPGRDRDSGVGIVMALGAVQSLTTSTAVDPAAGQYSDPVTLRATVTPTLPGATIAGTVQFLVDGVVVGTAPVGPGGVATLVYYIAVAQGPHTITGTYLPAVGAAFLGSSGTNTLTVTREDAVVTPSPSNPSLVKLTSPGTSAGPITVSATITEVRDAGPGNIGNAVPVTCTLTPAGSGTTYHATAFTTGSGVGATLTATCIFPSVLVNTYTLTFNVGGNYYTGSAQTTLTVAPYTK